MERLFLLDHVKFQLTIRRLCYELIENHNDFSASAILGLQPRGIHLSRRIVSELNLILPGTPIAHGILDNTFFRDDFRRETLLLASSTQIDFVVEDKKIILIDDVLFTGRTVRAGLDAMLAFGRPSKVELLVLVDRRFSRHLPIEADYIGIQVDSRTEETVQVTWKGSEDRDSVVLVKEGHG